VTTAGVPASNVAVSVNGEHVGTTDPDGEVEFTVPYAESIEVTVEPRENDSLGTEVGTLESASAGGFGAATFARQDDGDGTNGTTQRFDVNTNVRFQFDGEVEPGAELPLQVTIAGKQFENAAVSVAGERQGTTGTDGRVTVQIPEEASGVVELTATRDGVTKTTTYPVDDLSVAVSPSLLAPFPTTEATAHVTAGGEAVSDAVVQLNGRTIGTTDTEGRVQFEIPLSRVPAVTASAGDEFVTTYVDGVLPTLAVAVLAALAALGGVALTARRHGVTLDSLVDALVHVVSEAVSTMVGALVGVVDAVEELTAEFREAAEDGWRGVQRGLRPYLGASAPLTWGMGLRRRRGRPCRTRGGSRSARGGRCGDRPRGRGPPAVGLAALRGACRRRTPGDEDPRRGGPASSPRGFPREPVYALTNAFRDAAYGGRAAGSRLDRARDALASLRDDDEEGEDQ